MSIIGVIQYILLFVFVYFSNKYIDLEYYIRLLMYGHRVLNHFEKMSYFIKRSCFHNNLSELSEDDLTTIYTEDSLVSSESDTNVSLKSQKLVARDIFPQNTYTYVSTTFEEDEVALKNSTK